MSSRGKIVLALGLLAFSIWATGMAAAVTLVMGLILLVFGILEVV